MNKPLLFGFLGIVVVILGLPLLAQMNQGSPSAGTSAPPDSSGSSYTPPPVVNTGPDLNASTIVGSSWQVNTGQGPVTATFNPGGVLSARHALVGNINGSWQLSGKNVTLKASAMGRNITINLQINGNSLVHEGTPIQRLN